MTQPSQPGSVPAIRFFGRPGCSLGYIMRAFLYRSEVPFEWVELVDDEDARTRAGVSGLRDSRLPVCLFPDGTRLECPTIRQITEHLGWFREPSQREYDLAIYGAGPAGLSAAVYGASDGLVTILVERSAVGGQAGSSSKIENYMGVPEGISGAEMAERARRQGRKVGAEGPVGGRGVRSQIPTG